MSAGKITLAQVDVDAVTVSVFLCALKIVAMGLRGKGQPIKILPSHEVLRQRGLL